MNKKHAIALAATAAAVLVATGCAHRSSAEADQQAVSLIKSSFQPQGIAKLDRLDQDAANAACSKALGEVLPEAQAKAIEAANMKTVPAPPAAGYLGDWKQGEKIAQSGRGMTWRDKPGAVNGGNCYNCHQISKEEISFGTIGPSLYNYGKIRGVSDPASETAQPIVQYTWGKIWNAKAYNACSNMPRAGHMGTLNEQQIRHVMALLLDPASPVNK